MGYIAVAIWYAAAYQYYLNKTGEPILGPPESDGRASRYEFVAFQMYGPVGRVVDCV